MILTMTTKVSNYDYFLFDDFGQKCLISSFTIHSTRFGGHWLGFNPDHILEKKRLAESKTGS